MISNNFSTGPYFGNKQSKRLHGKLLQRIQQGQPEPSYPLNAGSEGSAEDLINAYAGFIKLTPMAVELNSREDGKPLSRLSQLVQNAFYRDIHISADPVKAHQQMLNYVPTQLRSGVDPFEETAAEIEEREKAEREELEQKRAEVENQKNTSPNRIMDFFRLNPNIKFSKDEIGTAVGLGESAVSQNLKKIKAKKTTVKLIERDRRSLSSDRKDKFEYVHPNASTGSLIPS